MINFDDYVNENRTEHNKNWPYIPDKPYRILIISGSGFGKTNALLNLKENQPDIDKIYLYAKNAYEAKYQYLLNKRESVGINHFQLNSVVTELFIRGRKLNISLVFITQSYFRVPKDVRLNTTQFFIAKVPNKIELQQIVINHSSDISPEDFVNIYRECTFEPYQFFVNDTTLASDNPLRFRKLFLEYNRNHDN